MGDTLALSQDRSDGATPIQDAEKASQPTPPSRSPTETQKKIISAILIRDVTRQSDSLLLELPHIGDTVFICFSRILK